VNGSRVKGRSVEELVRTLDAVQIWANDGWCGDAVDELQHVLSGTTPVYTVVHPTHLKGSPLLVMCALPEEFDALSARLKITDVAPSHFADGGATIRIGEAPAGHDASVVALSLMPRMGNVPAALATLDAIDSVRPRCAVLVGIAAGLEDEIKLGDVVVADVVVGYEATKLTVGREAFQGAMPEAQPELVAQIKGWAGAADWTRDWTRERDELDLGLQRHSRESVRIAFGAVASGEKVIGDGEFARQLKGFQRKVIAIEMEAHGFSSACIRRQTPFLVVKSITDYADESKDDTFREFACRAAADIVARLIHDRIL
jgi:adenosylhomocysteine nucleosidase